MADIPTTRHFRNTCHEQTDARHDDKEGDPSIPTRCKDHHDDHHPLSTAESAVDNKQTISSASADVDFSPRTDENLDQDDIVDMVASKSGSEDAQTKASNSYVCVPQKDENTIINQTYLAKDAQQPKAVRKPCYHVNAPSKTRTTTLAAKVSEAYGNNINVIPASGAYAAQGQKPIDITDHHADVEPNDVANEWQNITYGIECNSKNDADQADPVYDIGSASADVDFSPRTDGNLCHDDIVDMAASKSSSEDAKTKPASNSYICVPQKGENTIMSQKYLTKDAVQQAKSGQNPCNHIYAPSKDSEPHDNDINVIPESRTAQSGEPIDITDHDTNVEPYAVAYELQNSTHGLEYNSKHDADQADPVYDNDDIPKNQQSRNTNPSSTWNAQNWNPAYMQNVAVQASCTNRLFFYLQPSRTPDTTYTPGQPFVDASYTPGHSAVDNTYTPGQPAVDTTYTPGHSAVDTTYTPGQLTVDTTYTPGRTVVTTPSFISSHPTVLPLDPTGPKREASTIGVILSASSIQKGPVAPAKMWRDDWRCGWGFPAENGKDAECNPDGIIPCCSPGNWCGNTADHCDCPGCVDYRDMRGAGSFNRHDHNAAIYQKAYQTSTAFKWGKAAGACLAVDGSTSVRSCTHTKEGRDNPMWWVDLGQSYMIKRVVIFNRQDCCQERLNPFNIHIGDSFVSTNPKCGGDHHIALDQPSISVSCQGMKGRYVAVRLPGPSRTLSLCEGICSSDTFAAMQCVLVKIALSKETGRLINMAEDITTPGVTRVNANVFKGMRSNVFLNPMYGAGCNPSETDTDKTVEDDAGVEPHPVKSRGQNPPNMPNVPQQASCTRRVMPQRDGFATKEDGRFLPGKTVPLQQCTGICIAVMIIAAMLAMAMLISTQPVAGITYAPNQPAVDTTYTPGQPAVDTTYTPGQPAVDTTYTPGQPAVDTTYTPGQPAVDTTYTLGHTDVMTSSNISSHPTILPLDTTGPKRKESTNGVKTSASSIQKELVASEKMWRDDWRCGRGFPAENGKDAECDPDGNIPCCSPGNWCGYTVDHCDCPGCVDYRNMGGAALRPPSIHFPHVFGDCESLLPREPGVHFTRGSGICQEVNITLRNQPPNGGTAHSRHENRLQNNNKGCAAKFEVAHAPANILDHLSAKWRCTNPSHSKVYPYLTARQGSRLTQQDDFRVDCELCRHWGLSRRTGAKQNCAGGVEERRGRSRFFAGAKQNGAGAKQNGGGEEEGVSWGSVAHDDFTDFGLLTITVPSLEHRGYIKVNYKVFAQPKTYEAARQTCVSNGGHLADVKTQELHDLLLSEIQKVDGGRDYWIGLNDRTVSVAL
ncbi:hypothetical protein Bbelb_155910 [Branchiostoma belcheri]|nr:hypothetical protein Bbelb_155910 [Branchiostoma belcheri]